MYLMYTITDNSDDHESSNPNSKANYIILNLIKEIKTRTTKFYVLASTYFLLSLHNWFSTVFKAYARLMIS